MTEEEIRKKANDAFNESIMNNLDSSIIFKYIQGLEKENQELKKQLDNYKNKYKNRLNNQLAEGVEPDFEDFYLAEIEGKSNEYDELIIKQKEFIEWLENESKELIRDAGYHQRICLDILEKYKEIIGGNNE